MPSMYCSHQQPMAIDQVLPDNGPYTGHLLQLPHYLEWPKSMKKFVVFLSRENAQSFERTSAIK